MNSGGMSEVEQRAAEEATAFMELVNENILTPLIILLSALALLVFIYGAFQYVANAGNEQARADGRTHMLYGVIGLVVMLSAYALLRVLAASFGLEGTLDELRPA
jgi:TRAP-type C4-dicarboxylate transport system permease small subunit